MIISVLAAEKGDTTTNDILHMNLRLLVAWFSSWLVIKVGIVRFKIAFNYAKHHVGLRFINLNINISCTLSAR